MIKKIGLLILVVMLAVPCALFAEDGTLGISVPVFVIRMKTAAKGIKHCFTSKSMNEELLCTEDGNYVAEYDEDIVLYINTVPGTRMIKNIALAITVEDVSVLSGSTRRGRPGEETEYESLCLQIIKAVEPHIDEANAREILLRLGLYGPVLDGRQRNERHGGFTYIMKLQHDGTIVLVVAGV